jgi:pyruvate dehydrogenase E1 component alpha subunit
MLTDYYRTMLLIRKFEEKVIELVNGNEISGVTHESIGQEAVAVGVCAGLDPDDVITSTHRGHGHVLAKGADPSRMMAELFARSTGLNKGRGGSMHVADVGLGIYGANGIVGAGAPIALGAALASQYQETHRVAVSFFGDGGVNQGVVLESMNLAALWKLPVIFLCENNGYAVTLAADDAIAGTITGRAEAFNMPGITVDGMDVEAVAQAARSAIERARSGNGPTFLECRTYRYQGHNTGEHLLRLSYRTEAEIEQWRQRDPIIQSGRRLSSADREQIEGEVTATIERAVEFARSSPRPEPSEALDYMYASGLRARMGVA